VVELLEAVRACVDEHADELGRIDSVAGDGDHGIGMQRGSKAAAAAAHEAYTAGAGAGTVLTSAADAWADRAGGTSGALWGVALRRLGARIGDQDKPSAAAIAEGVHAARTGICDFGGAEVGDKTLVDVLVPFDEHLTAAVQQGSSLTGALQVATAAAEQAAEATAHLLPRRGRARPHAERSLGTPDPGAVSLSLIVRTIQDSLAGPRPASDPSTSTDHRDPA
jgi:D-erythrulose 4-kinase